MVNSGNEAIIVKNTLKDNLKKHLEGLGFVAGAKVKILTESDGNLIVYIKDSKLAIDRGMAQRVIVKLV